MSESRGVATIGRSGTASSAGTAGPAEPRFTISAEIVGRDAELAELAGVLEQRDGAHLVEVVGDPGIGRTRLLDEFADVARNHGALVLAGRAAPGDRDTPFSTFADAFDDQHDAVRTAVTDCTPQSRAALAAVLPWTSGDSAGPGSPAARRRAVRGLIERLATRHLVLILDDVHRADDASLALIAGLLRRPPRAPMTIVLSYRDRQADGRLRTALHDRSRQVGATVLRLGPLSEGDVDALLAGRGTTSWRQRLFRESNGNPAYLRVLLSEQPAISMYLDLPRTDSDARTCDYAVFGAELDGVTGNVRAVAEAGAVLGDAFDAETVAAMVGRPVPATLDAITDLIRRDVVRPVIRGQYFAFRHPVVRRAVYHGTELRIRVGLHTRADELLAARGASVAERAPHVVQRARYGDVDAVEILRVAGRTVTLSAPNTAAAWYRTALRILPKGEEHLETRARLLAWLAKARGGSGYLRECRDIVHEALNILPRRPTPLYQRVVAFAAQVQRLLGTYAEAEAMLRTEIVALADDDTSEPAGLLHFEMAAVDLANGDTDAAQRSVANALRIARQQDRSALLAASEGLSAMAYATAGDVCAAAASLDRAAGVLDGMLDAQFAVSTDAVVWIGWSEMLLERWDDALRHFDKAVEFATRSGHRLGLPHLLLGQMSALRNRGRLADAEAAVEHAVYLAAESGSPEQLISAHAMRSWLATMLDRADEATDADRIVTEYAKDSASGWCETLALRMLAEARLVAGNYDGCLTLATTVGGPKLLGTDACSRVAWYELLTRAELAAGRVDTATKWAESATADAAMLAQPGRSALAQLAWAQVLLAREPESALEWAQQAVIGLERGGMVMDALRAKVVLGNALWHQGMVDDALGELRSAQHAFEQINAVAPARHARTERRRLAARTPRGSGGAALTGRERQVADMVRQGLTNRMIAKQLHIAEKTVEMHLSNVFAKLGVSSRAAVAGRLSQNRQLAAGAGR